MRTTLKGPDDPQPPPTPQQVALECAVRSTPLSLSQVARSAQISKRSLQRYLERVRVPEPAIQSAIIRACNLNPAVCVLLAAFDGAQLIGSEGHHWLQSFLSKLVPTMVDYEERYAMPIDPRTAGYCADLINASWITLGEKRLAYLNAVYEKSSKLD